MRFRVSIRDVQIETNTDEILLPTLPDVVRELDDNLTSNEPETFTGIHWVGHTSPKIEIRWGIGMTVRHFQRVLDSNPEFDSAIGGMAFDSANPSSPVKAYWSGVTAGGEHSNGGKNTEYFRIKGWIGFFVER